jgi:phosphoglycerol transferase
MLKNRLGSLALYAGAAVLCLAALCAVMRLWRADLGVPFQNEKDALVTQVWVQNALASGRYYHSDRLGTPYGMDLRDFPASEALHLALMRAIALGARNTYAVINLFFLLTFVLTTLTALAVFRHFGAARLPALAGSVLYAFLPYHFHRGEFHLFLAAYYMVPPTVLVALWVYLGRLARGEGAGKRWLVALAVCLLVAGAGVYYAFFGCFFILVAGLGRAAREGKLRPALAALALAGTTCAGLAAALVPSHLYHRDHGENRQVARRFSWEAETFGLKINQLVLPVTGHRLEPLRRLKDHFNSSPARPLVNDYGSSLGVVGTAGCVLLLGGLLFRRRVPDASPLFAGLGVFLVCGLLLATVGGLGSLFAYLVSPQIRCYDRLSIFLGFFALFGAVWALDALAARAAVASARLRWAANGLCLLVLAGGLWDQTTADNIPPYAELKRESRCLAEFTARVEGTLPPGAMVLQLPYCPFPEGGTYHGMTAYDHFRLFMHSRSLRWSHGAVRGRYGAAVLADLAAAPVDESLDRIAAMGFEGIHIDRRGYADGGRDLEARLCALLGSEPLISGEGRDMFFDLRPYAERARQRYGDSAWARRTEAARSPTVVLFGKGFQVEERGEGGHWRWCEARGELRVVNPTAETRRLTLRFTTRTWDPGPARLVLSGPLLNATIPVGADLQPFTATVEAPPGEHVIALACDGAAYPDAECPTVFRLCDFEARADDPGEVPSAARAEASPGHSAGRP